MRVFQVAFEFIERKNLKKKFTAALKILIVSGEQSNLKLFNQMLAMRFAMLAAI